MKTVGWMVSAGVLGLSVACATAKPPAELVQARQAYATSERAESARYNPAALHEAKIALDRAETLFAEDEDSPEVRDAAYIATRRAEQALVEGEIVAMQHHNDSAAEEAAKAREEAAKQSESQLDATRSELQAAQRARKEAEKRAEEAMLELQANETAAVKQEEGGTVITVAGSFLFPSNKATLLPEANAKLDRIADALKQQADREILIEGHTDSRGPSDRNLELSKQRAEAVASYLSSRGVSREHITTDGVGAQRPIANNESAEGRATNRRVEITVQGSAH